MRRRQNKRPRFRPNISWPPIWTAILSTVPLVTIFLTLIGYGYDVAYLEEFGLSPTMVQHGPLDFLLRSTYAMVAVIKFYNELAQLLGTIEGLQTIWARLSWASYGAMALSMLAVTAFIAIKELQRELPFRSPRAHRAATFISRTLTTAWTWVVKTLSKVSDEWRYITGAAFFGWLFPLLLTYAVLLLTWASLTVAMFMLVMAPLIGIRAGERDARTHVINPQQCSHRSNEGAKQHDGALCARVLKGDNIIATGRLIEQSSTRIWLLRQHPWAVHSVPLDGAVVEYINDKPHQTHQLK